MIFQAPGFPKVRGYDRQQRKRDCDESQVSNDLRARRESAREQMRVGVAKEKRHLKKHHASGPYSGTSSKPRQNVLSDERLDLEKQECAEENGQRIHFT